jgi:hypothetical protein
VLGVAEHLILFRDVQFGAAEQSTAFTAEAKTDMACFRLLDEVLRLSILVAVEDSDEFLLLSGDTVTYICWVELAPRASKTSPTHVIETLLVVLPPGKTVEPYDNAD